MELKKLITDDSGGGDDDPLVMAFKHLLPEITEGVKAMREKEQDRPRRARGKAPAPEVEINAQDRAHAEDAVDVERDTETQTRLAFDFFAEKFLTPVLQLAEANEDAQTVGYYLARLIGRDDAVLNVVGQVLSENNFIDRLAMYNGGILQHAEWVDLTTAWLAHALWPDANDAPELESATKTATTDEKPPSDAIKDGGSADDGPGGDQGLEETSGKPHEPNPDPPGPRAVNDP